MRELKQIHNKDKRVLRDILDLYEAPPKTHFPRKVNIVADALRFGECREKTSWCVVAMYVVWKDHDGLMQIINREKLEEDGVDLSIPDALGMTFVWEKRCNDYPLEEIEEELMYPEIGV